MAKQVELREGARRQHRVVALFAVLQCWMRGLDGVVFDRPHLERLLGLKRFKATRLKWMREDFGDLFPFREMYTYAKNSSFASLYISRVKLKGQLPEGNMSDAKRISKIQQGGPKLGMFELWKRPTELRHAAADDEEFEIVAPFFSDFVNYDERLFAAYLSLLSQGQISPRRLPLPSLADDNEA